MKAPLPLDLVVDYHQRSKHRFEAYAAGPDTLDWDDQPQAFRWFDAAEKVDLPLLADTVTTPFRELYHTTGPELDRSTFERLAILLERSLGLAAWKSYQGASWALRCNPSSGNLHPTEAYIITSALDGLAAGVYHYLSRDHQLELRCRVDAERLAPLLSQGSLLIGLSSIPWREAWKYGERAYRYCQHDCGHAIAALSYAAAAVGWSVRVLDVWDDDAIERVLGLDRLEEFDDSEREHPDVMLFVEGRGTTSADSPNPAAVVEAIESGDWQGRANQLSQRHDQNWPLIEEVARACRKPKTAAARCHYHAEPDLLPGYGDAAATALFRQRRSAQHFDGRTAITARSLYRMLDTTLPRAIVPWCSLPWSPSVHLVLFVHRVTGLRPGLYVFARDAGKIDLLRDCIDREEFQWQKVPDCPDHLSLYSLVFANCQNTAATLCCHQAIAGDSAFSLGMLADFDGVLQTGAWQYRRLFWETGMLGQALYLEAEAAGVSGTGIGCYFDDPFHELLGIRNTRLQSLYHFTVGGALVDERLATIPPYSHLADR